jgi:hypothetical protein
MCRAYGCLEPSTRRTKNRASEPLKTSCLKHRAVAFLGSMSTGDHGVYGSIWQQALKVYSPNIVTPDRDQACGIQTLRANLLPSPALCCDQSSLLQDSFFDPQLGCFFSVPKSEASIGLTPLSSRATAFVSQRLKDFDFLEIPWPSRFNYAGRFFDGQVASPFPFRRKSWMASRSSMPLWEYL